MNERFNQLSRIKHKTYAEATELANLTTKITRRYWTTRYLKSVDCWVITNRHDPAMQAFRHHTNG